MFISGSYQELRGQDAVISGLTFYLTVTDYHCL